MRYGLDFYILSRRNSVFKGLKTPYRHKSYLTSNEICEDRRCAGRVGLAAHWLTCIVLAIMSILPGSDCALLTVVGWSLPDRMHSAMAGPTSRLFSIFCLLAVFGKLTLRSAVYRLLYRSTSLFLDSQSVFMCYVCILH